MLCLTEVATRDVPKNCAILQQLFWSIFAVFVFFSLLLFTVDMIFEINF